MTYGAAGDRDGNGWWAQMAFDTIGKADVAAGKPLQVKLPPVNSETNRVSAQARAAYEKADDLSFNSALPWSQGPRRMGTDKNGDVLWVGNSWGASLARIDTKTLDISFVPLPGYAQPYHAVVDSKHEVWTNAWMTDQVLRYDPASKTWTAFDLPTRGAEPRYISLLERPGQDTQVAIPYFRARKVAVMTLRSQAEIDALKKQAAQ
jgi:streptogramin lyase